MDNNIVEMILNDSTDRDVVRMSLLGACIGGNESIIKLLLNRFDSISANTNCCFDHDIAIGFMREYEKRHRGRQIKDFAEHAAEIKEIIEVKCPNGMLWTPLMLASVLGQQKAISLLLPRGPSITLQEKAIEVEHALSIASAMGHGEVVKLILAEAQLVDLTIPMMNACGNGGEEIVRILLNMNWDLLVTKLPNGLTALHLAAVGGSGATVELLLSEYPEGRYCCDKYNRTPLSYAAEHGREDAVQLLLAGGSQNQSLEDASGRTPLSYAAQNGHVNIVRLFLRENVESPNTND